MLSLIGSEVHASKLVTDRTKAISSDRTGGRLYFYALPGRLRIEIPALREDSRCADRIERRTAAIPGVRTVEISSITHRMLIDYDPDVIDQAGLLRDLRCIGCLAAVDSSRGTRSGGGFDAPPTPRGARPLHPLPELLLKTAAELLAKSLVDALLGLFL